MDYFDASEEVQKVIKNFISEHGEPPHQIIVSPNLYHWLRQIAEEEAFLQGKKLNPETIIAEFESISTVIDENLSDYEVLAQ